MIEFRLDKDQLKELQESLNRISPRYRDSVTRKAFKDLTIQTEKQLKINLTNRILHVRSGRLRSSIGSLVKDEEKDLVGLVGSGVRQGDRVKYANIHETGGVIRPKRGKYLAIPLSSALTGSRGQLRGGATSARDFPNTFFIKSKAGNLLIMQKQGGGAVPLFLLLRSVKIPARYYMTKTVNEMMPKCIEIMTNCIDKEVARRN